MKSRLKQLFLKRPSTRDLSALAERYFAQGQVYEAIAALTELNQRSPSVAVEQRLVEMRHQGFFSLKYQSRRTQWPPQAHSTYPQGAIPEIEAAQLNANALINGVIGHGALLVRDWLSAADCARMVEAVDSSIEAFAKPNPDTAQWFTAVQPCAPLTEEKIARRWVYGGGGALAADSPRGLFYLTDLLSRLGVPGLLTEYLGERPALSVKKTTLRRVSPDSNSGWHQDGAFLGSGIRTINLWIALTDCGVDAPSMDMVPARLSGIVTTGTGAADFKWSLDDQAVWQAAGDTPPVRLHFKAGDAIFFDELNLHRTAAEPSMTKTRYAIEAWFFAPSCYPVNQLPLLI